MVLQIEGGGRLEALTHSEDADQFDQHCGSGARCKERLHHVATKSQGHIGSHSWPGDGKHLLHGVI